MTSRGGKVVVIGAQGALGRLCAPALQRAGFEVIRAGRRPESASDFRLIDVSDADAVADGCADADLVISMANDPNHNAERFVLETGGAMFTVIVAPEERAELKALGVGARGLVVTDLGLGPGVTSLVLADLLARHPDADELESAGTFSSPSRPAAGPSKTSCIRG
jgi:saccharopine dehydrogenase-like NADP-dependent oxidoreductase